MVTLSSSRSDLASMASGFHGALRGWVSCVGPFPPTECWNAVWTFGFQPAKNLSVVHAR